MRKAIAIFFLFVFTASFTEAGQLAKLPLLLEHFTKHRCKDNTLSFVSFIKHHYLHDHKADGDEQQDNQLPFKTYPLNTNATVFVLTAELLFPQPLTCSLAVYGLPQNRFVLSDHLFGIFHPPRIV